MNGRLIWVVLLLIAGIIVISGCVQQPAPETKYVCPNGSIVTEPSLCLTTTKTPNMTPTATPTSTPTPTPTKTWHSVTTFSCPDFFRTTYGTGQPATCDNTTTTAPFYIQGDMWKLDWTVTAYLDIPALYPPQCRFSFSVYPVGETVYDVGRVSHYKGDASDTTYIYGGHGNFYIVVSAAGCQMWFITVKDYY